MRQIVVMIATLVALSAGAAMANETTAVSASMAVTASEFETPVAFINLFQRAKDYEQAYAEQGKKASPWLAKSQIIRDKTLVGWFKAQPWNYPPIVKAETALGIGWAQFKLASIRETPSGWRMELEPRDKKLAGFERMTITANEKDVTAVEIK